MNQDESAIGKHRPNRQLNLAGNETPANKLDWTNEILEKSSHVALIIAAHGSPIDPQVNPAVYDLAAQLNRSGRWASVRAAFRYGVPGFDDVMADVQTERAIVVPWMTSDGYFASYAKDKFQQAADQYPEKSIVVAKPVGTHPSVAEIFLERIKSTLTQTGWLANRSAVLLVGHGTRKNRTSQEATNRIARQLAGCLRGGPEIFSAFIDADPTIADAVKQIQQQRLLVSPFLISDGPHARLDVPRELGLPDRQVSSSGWNRLQTVISRGKKVLVDRPFGTWPGVELLIEERAVQILADLTLQKVQVTA